jgi:hypothetical protein
MGEPFGTLREFYPLYLAEHADRRCRRMHFAGTTLALVCIGLAIATPGDLAAGFDVYPTPV